MLSLPARSFRHGAIPVLLALLALTPPAQAQVTSWTGAVNSSWSTATTPTNWTAGIPATGSTVQFDSNSTANLATSNDLSGLSLSSIVIGVVPGSSPVSIGGNGFALTGAIGIDMSTGSLTQSLTLALNAGQSITLGGAQQWRLFTQSTAGSAQNLIISSPIAGAVGADLTYGVTNNSTGVASTGTIQLLAANTYAGNTTVGGPNITYVFGTNSPFGTGTVTQSSFNSAPKYQTNGPVTISNAMNWSSGFLYTPASTGSLTFGGPITLTGNVSGSGNRTVNNTSNVAVTFNGTITTSATGDTLVKTLLMQPSPGPIVVNGLIQDNANVALFTKAGTGTLTINNTTSTFGGQVAVQNGITEVALLADQNSPSSFGTGATTAPINIGASTTGATLRYIGSANSSTNRQLRLLGTTGGAIIDASGAGTVSFTSPTFGTPGAGTKTLTLTGTNTGLNTIAGVIANNSSTFVTALAKTGAGTWQLTGASTYSGATSITAGTLLANNGTTGSATGASAVSVAATGGSGGAGAVGTGGRLGGSGTITGAVTISSLTSANQGGVVYPGPGGGAAGTLNVGSMSWNPYGRYVFAYDAQQHDVNNNAPVGAGVNNLISGTGTLDLSNLTGAAPFDLNLLPVNFTSSTSPVNYTIAAFAGGIFGAGGSSGTQFTTGADISSLFTLSGAPNSAPTPYAQVVGNPLGAGQAIQLTFTPVPEPAFVLAACGGLTALAAWRRTRRRAGLDRQLPAASC